MENQAVVQKWRDYFDYDANQAASELCHLPFEEVASIAEGLGVDFILGVVLRLGTDASADILRNLPQGFREDVFSRVPQEKAVLLREILSYAPGTAGAAMAKEVLSVVEDSTIGATIGYLQSLSEGNRGKISYIYVVDKNRRLKGVIQTRDLIFYSSDKPVKDILKGPVVQVETGMSQIDVARLLQRHRYLGLPVIDAAQRLVGVISADTVMQVLENEALDDIAKMVGTSSKEIRTTSIAKILRSRLPWLSVNIVSGLACAFIVGLFQKDIATIATLFLFVPIVLGLSESTGVQGATIVVRNIAMGRVSFKDMGSLFFREVLVGIFIGLVCGFIVGAIASLWKASRMVGVALCVSMAVAIIISALIGLFLPILFKRFKVDPAIASGPLVLAICDIQTLIIYFNISGIILGHS
jgi:magnesium transporter